MSVESTTTGRVTTSGTGIPAITSAFTFAFWFKILSYSTQFTQVFSWIQAVGIQVLGGDTGELTGPPGTTFDCFASAASGASFNAASVLTASNTGWNHLVGSYPGSGTVYTFRRRGEGVSTFTNFTVDCGVQLTTPTIFQLFSDGGVAANTRLRSYYMQASNLSESTALTNSQSLSAPAGTNLSFLALDDATTAGTQSGGATGANWTITGTVTTQSGDNPDPSIGGGGGGSSLGRRLLLGVGRRSLDRRDWQQRNGGRIYSLPSLVKAA